MYLFEGMVAELAARLRNHKRLVAATDLTAIASILFLIMAYTGMNGRLAILFNLSGIPALAPGLVVALGIGICLAYLLASRRRRDIIGLVEANNPPLSERLRTAWDNRTRAGVIMEHLADEVAVLLRAVDFRSMVSYKVVALKVLIAIGCVSLMASSAAVEGVDSLTSTSPHIPFISPPEIPSLYDDDYPAINEDPFGEPSMAEVEGRELTLTLHPGYGADEMTGEGTPNEEDFEDSPAYPVDARYGGSYTENIPPEHRELIKRYFFGLLGGT